MRASVRVVACTRLSECVCSAQVGLNEFLANYVLPRAYSAAEADFLEVKAHVRYSCEVTDTTGEGDQMTYEVTTTLEFEPCQKPSEGPSDLVLEQSAAAMEAITKELAAKFDFDFEAGMAHLKEQGLETQVAEKLAEIEQSKNQTEDAADAEGAAAEGSGRSAEAIGRTWAVHKTYNQLDALCADLEQGDLRTPGIQIEKGAFPERGAAPEEFTKFLTEVVLENLDKSCVPPFLWATEVAL